VQQVRRFARRRAARLHHYLRAPSFFMARRPATWGTKRDVANEPDATTRCVFRLFKVSRGDWDGTDGLFADVAPERVAAESSEVGRLLW
jgi:hypothetical protein